MTDQVMLGTLDRIGIRWTIVADAAVVGFQWTVYCYRDEVLSAPTHPVVPSALDMLFPGGVANGWTDSSHCNENIRALLIAIMSTKGHVPADD